MSSGSWASLSRPSHSRMEDHKKINIKKFNMKDCEKSRAIFYFYSMRFLFITQISTEVELKHSLANHNSNVLLNQGTIKYI